MSGLNRSPSLAALKRELAQAAQGNRAGYLAWFKTGKGEYAEGEEFIGVRVPTQRALALQFQREVARRVTRRINDPHSGNDFVALLHQFHSAPYDAEILLGFRTRSIADLGWPPSPFAPFLLRPLRTR